MGIYFIFGGIIQYYTTYFVVEIFHLRTSKLFVLAAVSLSHTPTIFVYYGFFLFTFWSSYTFPAAALVSIISPETPSSFYWRTGLETKIWILCSYCYGDIIVSRPSDIVPSRKSQGIFVFILTHVYTCINLDLY